MPCTTQSLPLRPYRGSETSLTPSSPRALQINRPPPVADQQNNPSYHTLHQDNPPTPLEAPNSYVLQHSSPSHPPEKPSPWEAQSWPSERDHHSCYLLQDPRDSPQFSQACASNTYPQTWTSSQEPQPSPWRPTLDRQKSHHHGQTTRGPSLALRPAVSFPIESSYGDTRSSMSPTWCTSSTSTHSPGGLDFPSLAVTHSFSGRDEQYQHPYSSTAEDGAPSMIADSASVFTSSDYGDNMLTPGSTCTVGRELVGENSISGGPGLDDVGGMYNRQGTAIPSAAAKKPDEPYASLLYRAFMSHPRHAMTLQEVYQWFRDNTTKDDLPSKGWQNSIRHNLSMNGAFERRERVSESPGNDAGDGPSPPGNNNNKSSRSSNNNNNVNTTTGKKPTEWFLLEWAAREGVQSTTRYRSNSRRRGGGNKTTGATSTPRSKRQSARGGPTVRKGAGAGATSAMPRSRIRTARHVAGGGRAEGAAPTEQLATSEGASLHQCPQHPGWDAVRARQLQHQLRPGHFLPSGEAASFEEQQHQHSFAAAGVDYQEMDLGGAVRAAGGGYSPALLLLAPASVKSEGDGDEVITPEANFSFHEPGVLLPELQGPATGNLYGGGDMVALYSGGGGGGGGGGGAGVAGQVDLSQYTMESVGGVYDGGLFRGCVWNQEDSYDQC